MNETQIATFLYTRTDKELILAANSFLNQKLNLSIEEAVAFLRHFLPSTQLPFFGYGGK
jgi:hypothetical protein